MLKAVDNTAPRPREFLPADKRPPYKGFEKPVLIIALLTALALAATACEDFGRFPAPSPAPEEPETG